MPIDTSPNVSLRRSLWLLAGLSAIFLLIWLLPTPAVFRGIANYQPMHMTMELFSIVVAMLIFGVVWNAYSDERAGNVMIIAVADVVEAMMSHRPYRAALGVEKALEEMREGRGRLYDPDVVDVCLVLFEQRNFQFSLKAF